MISKISTKESRETVSLQAARCFLESKQSENGNFCGRTLLVFPVFNEEECLPYIFRELRDIDTWLRVNDIDVCFVDDGSTDRTPEILAMEMPSRFVIHSSNIGVSGVILTAIKIAALMGYKIVVQCDADGQHPISGIPRLLGYAKANDLDLTIGSRFLDCSEVGTDALRSTTLLRRIGGRFISILIKILFGGIQITDPTSGFRVYSRRALESIEKEMPEKFPEPASIGLIARDGLRIGEIQVDMFPRITGHSSIGGWKNAVVYMWNTVISLVLARIRRPSS